MLVFYTNIIQDAQSTEQEKNFILSTEWVCDVPNAKLSSDMATF
jgi:hypothetical protein